MLTLIVLQHFCSCGKILMPLLYSAQVICCRVWCAWITSTVPGNPNSSSCRTSFGAQLHFVLNVRAHRDARVRIQDAEGAQQQQGCPQRQRWHIPGTCPRGGQQDSSIPIQMPAPPRQADVLKRTHSSQLGTDTAVLDWKHQILRQKSIRLEFLLNCKIRHPLSSSSSLRSFKFPQTEEINKQISIRAPAVGCVRLSPALQASWIYF